MHILAPGSMVYMRDTLQPRTVERFEDSWEPNERFYEVYSEDQGEKKLHVVQREEMVADWEIDPVFVADTCRALTIVHPDFDDAHIVNLATKIAVANYKEPMHWKWCIQHLLTSRDERTCEFREGGGVRCEVMGEHDKHQWTKHTIMHLRKGNGWSCIGF